MSLPGSVPPRSRRPHRCPHCITKPARHPKHARRTLSARQRQIGPHTWVRLRWGSRSCVGFAACARGPLTWAGSSLLPSHPPSQVCRTRWGRRWKKGGLGGDSNLGKGRLWGGRVEVGLLEVVR